MRSAGVRVFVTSYPETQSERMGERLRHYHALSDGRHALTHDLASADIVLVGALGNEVERQPYLRQIVRHEVVGKYPDKCFSLSLRDQPVPFNRGIYESSSAGWLSRGRVRTGAYARSSFNTLVAGHQPVDSAEDCKRYLFSFIGRASHPVRTRLFQLRTLRDDILIEDSSSFNFWGDQDEGERLRRLRHYYDALCQSRFSLCPRGVGTGSIRLFESMLVGVAPIIISDGWLLPKGPTWDDFAIVVKERHAGEVEHIAAAHEASHREMGQRARQAYLNHFADDRYFNYVVDNCVDMLRTQRVSERHYWAARYLVRMLVAPDSLQLALDLPRYYLSRLGSMMRGRQ